MGFLAVRGWLHRRQLAWVLLGVLWRNSQMVNCLASQPLLPTVRVWADCHSQAKAGCPQLGCAVVGQTRYPTRKTLDGTIIFATLL